MSDKTYGVGMPSASATTVTDNTLTNITHEMPGLNLWGHSIVLDGEQGIKCQACDKEEELPELLSMSSGFREVVYKMYILGKFKKETCSPDPEDIEDMMDDLDKNGPGNNPLTNKNHRVPPGNTHWVDTTTTRGRTSAQSDTVDMYVPKGQRMMVEGTPYIYHGDGTWVNEDRNIAVSTIDLFDKHGKTAEKHFPPEIVQEKKDKLKRRQDMMQQQSLDSVGIGDVQDNAGPQIQGNQVNQSQNQGINIDGDMSDKSMAEKLGAKLSRSENHFLTR